jgi:Ca2+-binding RTX toxin-like protein
MAESIYYEGKSTARDDIITGQGLLHGLEGNDLITDASTGTNDLIFGGGGNDIISSRYGNDYIYGGTGNDIIYLGNTGISYADGEAGKDKFVLHSGKGYTKIMYYNPKEDRVDASECGVGELRLGSSGSIEILSKKLNTIAYLEGSGYNLTGNLKTDCENLGIITKDYGIYGTPQRIDPTLKISNTLISEGSSTNVHDTIIGQGYMNGYEGDDIITGSQGNDLIYGGSGNDIITAGGGSDYIYGEEGDDIINLKNIGTSYKGGGISFADGGAGFDKFILNSYNGYAKIMAYNPKEDRVDASECGVIGLRLGSSGSIEILSKNSNTIACLEGSGYSLTGNLQTDCKNLGIIRQGD